MAGTLNFALRLAVYVSVPATVGLVLLSTPITRVLFQRGRFGPEDTAATAIALIWYAVGLVGFAGARIAAQAFYAVARPGIAVRLGRPRHRRQPRSPRCRSCTRWGTPASPCASSIGAYVNLFGLLWAARRDFGSTGWPGPGDLRRAHAGGERTAGPLVRAHADTWRRPAGLAQEAAWLAVTIAGGAVVFWAPARSSAAPERATLLGVLPSRRRR